MGAIADFISAKGVLPPQQARGPSDGDRSRNLWREVFGSTDKETGGTGGADHLEGRKKPIPGGGYGRSLSSSDASYKRLLEALRSMAPGGWSDDRWGQSRHFIGAIYLALHRKCTQLQQAEFQLFKKDRNHPDGKRVVTPDDPEERPGRKPYDLVTLLEKPNNQDTFGLMMYRWGQQQGLTGMALTMMVPDGLGVPRELYCIPTAIAIPQPAINPDYPDGYYRIQPVYPYGPFSSYPTPTTAVGAPIPAQWMLRFLYPHPFLRYDGFSPLTGLAMETDELEQIKRSRWYKMKRSVNPSAVLNMDATGEQGVEAFPEQELTRIHAEWENEFQGTENHGRLIVCPPGGSLEEFGRSIVDMDYPNGWDQTTGFLLAALGVTKPAAGLTDSSSYATLFAAIKQMYLMELQPYCDNVASLLTKDLAPFYGDDLILEIRCRRIDDHEITFTKVDKLMAAKAGTKNEVRKLLDLPLTEEPWGEDIAGDPSEAEKEQQQQQEMPGMDQMGEMMEGTEEREEANGLGPMGSVGEEEEENEANSERPTPGPLGRGSLGPRKGIDTSRYFNGESRIAMAVKNRGQR